MYFLGARSTVPLKLNSCKTVKALQTHRQPYGYPYIHRREEIKFIRDLHCQGWAWNSHLCSFTHYLLFSFSDVSTDHSCFKTADFFSLSAYEHLMFLYLEEWKMERKQKETLLLIDCSVVLPNLYTLFPHFLFRGDLISSDLCNTICFIQDKH